MTRASVLRPRRATDAEHGVVHRDEGAFCGWPFVHGMWRTVGGDVLLAFRKTPASYGAPADLHHDGLNGRPGSRVVLLRSRDGGRSWAENATPVLWDYAASAAEVAEAPDHAAAAADPIDFGDPDTLVASGSTPAFGLPESRSWVRVSRDGGESWGRPLLLPLTGLASLSGNGSATVRADGRSLLFLTTVSGDGWTRRPLVYGSRDDGAAWAFLAFVTPRHDDGAAEGAWSGSFRFGGHRWFYPRAIQLADGRLLCALRSQRDPTGVMWTEVFASDDGGLTWGFLSRVNDWGAPGDLVEMADGRIACVYGYRLPPWGIRARVSADGGRRWGSEIVLRDDGGSWDLGYPRVTELAPGRLLAVYYFNRKDDPVQREGGVRHIARTIFSPD